MLPPSKGAEDGSLLRRPSPHHRRTHTTDADLGLEHTSRRKVARARLCCATENMDRLTPQECICQSGQYIKPGVGKCGARCASAQLESQAPARAVLYNCPLLLRRHAQPSHATRTERIQRRKLRERARLGRSCCRCCACVLPHPDAGVRPTTPKAMHEGGLRSTNTIAGTAYPQKKSERGLVDDCGAPTWRMQ